MYMYTHVVENIFHLVNKPQNMNIGKTMYQNKHLLSIIQERSATAEVPTRGGAGSASLLAVRFIIRKVQNL